MTGKSKRQHSASLQAARLTAGAFLLLIVIGALLLSLPISTHAEGSVPLLTGIFTATSAVCLTGLIVVDTATYWTPFGQAVIFALIQIGGLGIMTLATLTGMLLVRKNVVEYNNDWLLLSPLMFAVILGGLGFSVLVELVRRLQRRRRERVEGQRWARGRMSITSQMTLWGTGALLLIGFLVYLIAEWHGAFEGFSVGQKVLNALFGSVTARTAGFNAIDYAQVSDPTLLATNALMFIGGGSAGTAGGVKITTFVVLLAAMWTELIGEREVILGHRRIPDGVVRQAMTVAGAGVLVVGASVIALRTLNPHIDGDRVTFEVFSAFGTVGLSTGITALLDAPSQIILCLLMYLGRIGPITLVAALAAINSARHFRYPEERPLIG